MSMLSLGSESMGMVQMNSMPASQNIPTQPLDPNRPNDAEIVVANVSQR